MLTAIRLNNQPSSEMHEIDDVRPYRLLSAEFLPIQAMIAQMTPE